MRPARRSDWSARFFGRNWCCWPEPCLSVYRCSRNLAVWKAPCCIATCRARRSLESSASTAALLSSMSSQRLVLPFSAATCSGVQLSSLRVKSAFLLSWCRRCRLLKMGRWPARAAMCRKDSPALGLKFFRRCWMSSTYLSGQASASISSICAHQGSVSRSHSSGSSVSSPRAIAQAAQKFWKPFTRNFSSVLPSFCVSRMNMAWPAWKAALSAIQELCRSGGSSLWTSSALSPGWRFSCILMPIFSRMSLHCSTFWSLLWRSACCLLCTRCSMTSIATR
mmetsp:Transcript_74577/g.192418  ORF Transcript_74577/g.192418 Transcript_74577/m.192418 type:complete len:280 (-) Transcript_74577:300-1139(-)